MKLSVFTTVTNPLERGDLLTEPLACYDDLADELVVVDGSTDHLYLDDIEFHIRSKKWAKEFKWDFIGQQFQRGYEACTGDWVIHADLDFIFHEGDFSRIRKFLIEHDNEPAVSFWKYQFIQPDRYTIKSRLVVAVNKGKFGDRIKFNSGGDLCQPSLDGEYIKPENVPEARVPIFNYEKITKTADQAMDDAGRMARAWHRQFGNYKLGGLDNESAFDEWFKMVKGRYSKPSEEVPIEAHPKYMRSTILELKPKHFGYSGWGMLGENNYVKSSRSSR